LRVRECDDFLHVTGEVDEADIIQEAHARGEGDALTVRTPRNLADDVVHIRELPGVAAARVHDEDVVSVAIPVRAERELRAIGGHVEIAKLPDFLQKAARGERDLPLHGPPMCRGTRPGIKPSRLETWRVPWP